MHPDHIADLARSGISVDAAIHYGIHTVTPPKALDKILPPSLKSVETLLAFPYPQIMNGDGKPFTRYKLFPAVDKYKYFQAKGTGVHLYITEKAWKADEVWVTEGEKKALALDLAGFPAVGLGGVWNFETSDWKRLSARKVVYIPDSDAWEKREVKQSIGALRDYLHPKQFKILDLRRIRYGKVGH